VSSDDYQAKSRYSGSIASNYNQARNYSTRWLVERDIVLNIASTLDPTSSVLDAPVGTGRFLDDFRNIGFTVTGLDISNDMLAEARLQQSAGDDATSLVVGDLEALPFDNNEFDAAFCVRFLNWVPSTVMASVIAELARVSKTLIVLHIRTTRSATLKEMSAAAAQNFAQLFSPYSAKRTLKSTARAFLGRGSNNMDKGYVLHAEETVVDALTSAGLTLEYRVEVNTRISVLKRHAAPQYFYVAKQIDTPH
jgi:ubiquinone/menaquinone biosynthesis C-methylase UbiE